MNYRKLSFVFLLALMVAVGMLTEPVHAASYPFTSTTIYADGTRTAKFTCNGMTGLCCEAGAYSTYSGTASLSRMKNMTNAARCAYYYGYGKGWTSGSNGHKLARLLSYCMGHGTGGDYKTSTMKSLLNTAKKTTVPDGFECWLCKPNGSSKQDFIVWKYPKGKLKVVKKSADTAVSKKGAYNLAGITIKVYRDADCKDCVKTLTTDKNGSTGGAFALLVGTYYVKETKVPDSTGFKQNTKVFKVSIKSGSTVTVTIKNEPALGSIALQKKTIGEGGVIEGFRFVLTGKTSGKTYAMVTGPDGYAEVTGLPFGKYTLTEDLTEEQEKCYTDQTGIQTVTLAKGAESQHITLERENSYEPRQRLKIVKRTGDSGPVEGFSFRITWTLADAGSISAEDIVKMTNPQVELSEHQKLGIWQIADPAEIEVINTAAASGRTGDYTVRLKNRVTMDSGASEAEDGTKIAEDSVARENANVAGNVKDAGEHGGKGSDGGEEVVTSDGSQDRTGKDAEKSSGSTDQEDATASGSDGDAADGSGDAASGERDSSDGAPQERAEDIEVVVHVTLTGRDTDAQEAGDGNAPGITAAKVVESEAGSLNLRHADLRFSGAATTGEEVVTTGRSGQYVTEHIRPGIYTVTEEMTDSQKKRYRQPKPKRVEVTPDSAESIVFTFVNQPIQIPVRLQKASADGVLEDVEFTITGTPDYMAQPMEEITVRTDAAGVADFGMLYPGQYIVEETGFDDKKYVNSYPMEGKDRPAFAFTVTGEELTEAEIQEGKALWLGGEDGKGTAATEETVFRNVPYVDLWLTKVDGVTRSFLPGAEFSLKDGGGKLAARLRIDADENEQPLPVMLESNGIVTAEAGEESVGASRVIGGSTMDADETKYQCVVLRGLVEGERYTLTEEQAPEGFTPLEEPYVFTVTLDERGEPVLNTCDEYGANIAAAEHRGTLVIVNDAPSIGTTALDRGTGDHIAEAEGTVTLTDRCQVTNLAKGRTYTLVARLMDNTEYLTGGNESTVTQVSLDGIPVTGQMSFEATGKEQTIEVPIVMQAAALKGRSTVIYEALYTGEVTAAEADGKTAAAEESDPANASQTIVFPRIGTTAALTGEGSIVDKVRYQNLLPGRNYVMKGWLMDRETGEPVPEDYGGTSEETEFNAEQSGSGEMSVPFEIDTERLASEGITELVVFEECYLQKNGSDGGETRVRVASHKDLTDADQSVKLPPEGTPRTGDEGPPWMALTLLLAAALPGIAIWHKGRVAAR